MHVVGFLTVHEAGRTFGLAVPVFLCGVSSGLLMTGESYHAVYDECS